MRLSRRFVLVSALLAFAAFALTVPAGAHAQSAGDEQYVDPFQNEGGSGGGGGGGNSGGEGTGQDNDAGTTTGDTGSGTTGTDTGSGTAGTTTGTEDTTPTDGATLPATGLPVAVAFGAGLLLLGSGFSLRRSA
jgi:hypothetical protein